MYLPQLSQAMLMPSSLGMRKTSRPDVLDAFGIELQTPDEFVVNQVMLRGPVAVVAIKAMRERWERPQYTAAALVDLLEKRGLPQTAAHLRDVVDLI